MIFAMSKWNISGDALTIEQTGRRSPSQWLRQNGLRIAVMAGLAEAVLAWVTGHRVLLLMIGVLSAIVYLNVRHRLPELIRRPLWIVVMAQAIGGLIAPLIYLGVAMFVIVAGMLLVILALVMLGDRMRR
jgi:peptidoglycan/LPS O-acetylase OafA/YrhL